MILIASWPAILLFLGLRGDLRVQAKPVPGLPAQARYDLQGEVTAIGQDILPFHAKYSGPNSLPANGQAAATETATLYMGIRPLPNLEAYLNPELAWGNAPGGGQGLAAYSNGDLIGQPNSSGEPYIARAFLRWRIPMKQRKDQPVGKEYVGRAQNVIAGPVPRHRLVFTFGKFAATDIFDFNSYANNPRTQFINNAFVNNLAYDYPEDTRGYGLGASLVLVNPNYSIRVGTFAMPTQPGGDTLAYVFPSSHSEDAEVEFNPQILRSPKPPLTVRFTGYRNVGYMGRYRDALAAAPPLTTPDLTEVRMPGMVRTGFGINMEQPLANGGATGLFARAGWADGGVETDGFAESDSAFSLGAQISGAHWKRAKDIFGVAYGQSGISGSHQQYLGEGGLGFNLGDGALSYGPESVFEAYYLYQVSKSFALTADAQLISCPGYNRDRGPANILSLRARYAF